MLNNFAPATRVVACGALLSSLALACSTTATSSDAGTDAAEAGVIQDAARTCSSSWRRVDFDEACLAGAASVSGLCEVGISDSKGTYPLCARSPEGVMYVASTAGGQRFEGAGWAFGPRAYVEQRLGLPLLAADQEAFCDRAIGFLGPPNTRVCGAVDAGAGLDASPDAGGD